MRRAVARALVSCEHDRHALLVCVSVRYVCVVCMCPC